MPEAHELAKLKDRLTPAEQARRRAKMHRRGIGRIDTERRQQDLMNASIAAFSTTDRRLKKQDRLVKGAIIAVGVLALIVLGLSWLAYSLVLRTN